jgi:hypothetical protein
LNCGRGLEGAYCAGCGQKAGPVDPTFHDLVDEFAQEALNVDGRMLRSARLLLARPGFLTREYVDGKRASYVPPLRLYLIFSLMYFALAAAAPPPKEGGLRVQATYDETELQQLGFTTNTEVVQTVERALHLWAPRVMFVLVPLFALLVKNIVRRSGRHYPQHLYFALHLHAAAFAILAVGVLARWARGVPYVEETVGAVATIGLLAYAVLAFRGVYGGTTARAVVRTVVVGVIYMTAVAATVVAIGVWVLPPLR